ncbi:hypothetical protein JOQ06_023964, partial [Pogonophryne albipinna]
EKFKDLQTCHAQIHGFLAKRGQSLVGELMHQLKAASWSGMMTLWGLRFDRKPGTRLIRLFSHTEKRRSHPLSETDTCLLSARGPVGQEPPTQEPKKQ